MEQINIILFVLTSFFGISDGRIASEKTTVTVNPKKQEVTILQENLFTLLQSKKDSALAIEQWNTLTTKSNQELPWISKLQNFETKELKIKSSKGSYQAMVTLHYSEKDDLRVLGIWYDEEKQKFSINNSPKHNIKSNSGELEGNYWYFGDKREFNFSLEPFVEVPVKLQEFKRPIGDLLGNN